MVKYYYYDFFHYNFVGLQSLRPVTDITSWFGYGLVVEQSAFRRGISLTNILTT